MPGGGLGRGAGAGGFGREPPLRHPFATPNHRLKMKMFIGVLQCKSIILSKIYERIMMEITKCLMLRTCACGESNRLREKNLPGDDNKREPDMD